MLNPKQIENRKFQKLQNFMYNTREKFQRGEINKNQYETLVCNVLLEHRDIPILTIESIVSVVLHEF